MPRRLPEKQITFRQPSRDVASIAAFMALSDASRYFGSHSPLSRGCEPTIVQISPYFLIVGKSAGPSRSMPTSPIRLAAEQRSSSETLP